MLAPIQRSAPTCFSWLKIPDYLPGDVLSKPATNTIPNGPLLVLLNYYSAVTSFNLSPVIHKAFNKNPQYPGITHAEVPRECWKPEWNSSTSSFNIQKVGTNDDHSFWRWIGCQIFAGQQSLYNQLSKCVLAQKGFCPIPLFGSPNGQRFFSFASTLANASPAIDPLTFFAQNADLIHHLSRITWKRTQAFHHAYRQNPLTMDKKGPVLLGPEGQHLESRLDQRPLGEVAADIHLLLRELAQNREALQAIVALCADDTTAYSAKAALTESANKLLELVEPMLHHTVFMAPGRFFRGNEVKALPTDFPVSLHADASFGQIHKKKDLLFTLTPKDTPKISKPNLSVEEGSEQDHVIKQLNTEAYYNPSDDSTRALTVPLTQWQELVQNDYGYERVFQEGVIHDFKKWNRLWATLDGWYDLNGLKKGEDLTNIGFDTALYFFPPEPQIDVLYKSYQTAIKTVKKKQEKMVLGQAVELMKNTGRDLPTTTVSLLQNMVANSPESPLIASPLDTHALLKAHQKAPDTSPHAKMVETSLFRDNMNCFGLLKEQVLGGEGESADHFGLNTHQRLFCHHALNGTPTHPGQPTSRQGISPLIALNGPPGTGKTTVLQAVVASEVVRSALTNTPMPILVGASATHQAKSNIIGGFKHEEVHPSGSPATGIWQRWLKALPAKPDNGKNHPAVTQFDYGLELSQQGTVSERLGRIHEHRQALGAHWQSCFQQALQHPLESPSQAALRARLNDLFKDNYAPVQAPTYLKPNHRGMDSLHHALQQWWQAADAHERYAGELIRQAHHAAHAFDADIHTLQKTWNTLDPTAQSLAIQAISNWLENPGSLVVELPIDQDPLWAQLTQQEQKTRELYQVSHEKINDLTEQAEQAQEEMASWEESTLGDWKDEVGEEWETIATAYNRAMRFCPPFLFRALWAVKSKTLKDTIKTATAQAMPKEAKRTRRHEYWQCLNHLQEGKLRAEPFKIPETIVEGAALSLALREEKAQMNAKQEFLRGQLREAKAIEEEIQTLLDSLTQQRLEIEQRHAQQEKTVKQVACFFTHAEDLDILSDVLLDIQKAARPQSMDWKKAQMGLEMINNTGPDSLLGQALAVISNNQPIQRNAASVADDIANILGAWVDNAYKPTCFHLAARWNEGKVLEEMNHFKSFTKLPTQEELTQRLQMLARIYPVMVSTLHAIGNRMATKENGESLTGIGTIDTLVVDEAGQVPMTLGGLGLLLAKRCLAVGDLDQLEPIWEIEAEDDTALFKTLAGIPRNDLTPLAFAELGWDCHAGSLLALVQKYTPWSPYHGTLQRGLYLLEHNRCPIEIISYCDALSYQGQLRCKITSHYREQNEEAAYQPFLTTHNPAWGGRLVDKMSIQQCQNRALNPGNPVAHPISIIEHQHNDVSNGSRTNVDEAKMILAWLDQHFAQLTKGRGKAGADAPIADRVAIITPFTAQARKIFQQAKSFDWPKSGLKENPDFNLAQLFNDDRKSKTTQGPNKTLTIGTVHSLQGAEVDIVLFSNVYGEGSAGSQTFQDRNPQIMNVAVSRAKQAFVLFANRDFIAGIKPDQPSAVGLLVNQVRMLEQAKNP